MLRGNFYMFFIEKFIKSEEEEIPLPNKESLEAEGFEFIYEVNDMPNIECLLKYDNFIELCKKEKINTVFIKKDTFTQEMCLLKKEVEETKEDIQQYYDYDVNGIKLIDMDKYSNDEDLPEDFDEEYIFDEEEIEEYYRKEILDLVDNVRQDVRNCFVTEWNEFISNNIQCDEEIGTVQLLAYSNGIRYITILEYKPKLLFTAEFILNYNEYSEASNLCPECEIIDFIQNNKLDAILEKDWFLIGIYIKNEEDRKDLSKAFEEVRYNMAHIDEIKKQKKEEMKYQFINEVLNDIEFANCTNSQLRKRYAEKLIEERYDYVLRLFPPKYRFESVDTKSLNLFLDEIYKRYRKIKISKKFLGEILSKDEIEEIAYSLKSF